MMQECYIKVAGVYKRLKEMQKELGEDYRIVIFDGERVIYRDFGNGYDIEISRMNTNKKNAKGTIYIWEDRKRYVRAYRLVPRDRMKQTLMEIEAMMPTFVKPCWTLEEAVICSGRSKERLLELAKEHPRVLADSESMIFDKDELLSYIFY